MGLHRCIRKIVSAHSLLEKSVLLEVPFFCLKLSSQLTLSHGNHVVQSPGATQLTSNSSLNMSRQTRSSPRKQSEDARQSSPGPPGSMISSTPASIPTLCFENQSKWETWLAENHATSSGLWVQIAKKNSNIPSVTYDEALDIALCFGWIDGQRKSYDERHFVQRFTPRRKKSLWSKRNVDKVAKLTEAGRMQQSGQVEIDTAKADGRWDRAYSSASVMEVPLDFQTALEVNEKARKFFDALNKTQRYSFLWRIETTKRPETRKRKIGQFVDLLAEHKTL